MFEVRKFICPKRADTKTIASASRCFRMFIKFGWSAVCFGNLFHTSNFATLLWRSSMEFILPLTESCLPWIRVFFVMPRRDNELQIMNEDAKRTITVVFSVMPRRDNELRIMNEDAKRTIAGGKGR